DYPGEKPDPPTRDRLYCLDCSGYMRMIWGYRHHLPGYGYVDNIPLSRKIRPDQSAIPRRSFQISESAPGVTIIPNRGVQIVAFSGMPMGDLLCFDADTDDGVRIDHIGMYMGVDSASPRRHRFISSRKSTDGPTMSDNRTKSVLDGTGLYARSFRTV